MEKDLYYFFFFISPFLKFIEVFSFLLVVILSLFAARIDPNERNFFRILGIYFLLLSINKLFYFPLKALITIVLEVLLLISLFLLIKPYLKIPINSYFLIPVFIFLFIIYLSYHFVILPSLSSLFPERVDIIIIFIDSLAVLLISLKVFIHFRGTYMFPWLYIFLGGFLKCLGSILIIDNLLIPSSLFIFLGILKYLEVYSV